DAGKFRKPSSTKSNCQEKNKRSFLFYSTMYKNVSLQQRLALRFIATSLLLRLPLGDAKHKIRDYRPMDKTGVLRRKRSKCWNVNRRNTAPQRLCQRPSGGRGQRYHRHAVSWSVHRQGDSYRC